jgi:hypothetical protein
MEKTITIHLKFPKNSHHVYSGIHLPKKMQIPGLLKIIGANELIGVNPCSGHTNLNESYRSSGELENGGTYEIHTPDLEKSLELVRDYNHENGNGKLWETKTGSVL